MKKKDVNKKILVIGSELEGIVLCDKLAVKGYKVILTEEKNYLGGRLNKNRLSSLTFKLNEKIKSLENNKNVTILKNTFLLSLTGTIGSFKASLLNDSKILKEDVSMAIVSAGADFIPSFNYISDNFIPFSVLNKFLDPQGTTRAEILKIANKTFKKIALYAAKDSSSRYSVNEYFQHALYLKKRYGSEVSMILPQVLVAGDELEKVYKEIRDAGILIFKYDKEPDINYMDKENVLIDFKDSEESNRLEFDLFVSSEKTVNSSYFEKLREILKISLYNNINFQSLNSSRKGIYLCGICREDLLNKECVNDAIALAEEIDESLKSGKLEYEEGVINVDKKKCTLCLTCVRACPHGAIEMDRDILDERVIKIYDEACFHCGTCVGECPAKALAYNEEAVVI